MKQWLTVLVLACVSRLVAADGLQTLSTPDQLLVNHLVDQSLGIDQGLQRRQVQNTWVDLVRSARQGVPAEAMADEAYVSRFFDPARVERLAENEAMHAQMTAHHLAKAELGGNQPSTMQEVQHNSSFMARVSRLVELRAQAVSAFVKNGAADPFVRAFQNQGRLVVRMLHVNRLFEAYTAKSTLLQALQELRSNVPAGQPHRPMTLEETNLRANLQNLRNTIETTTAEIQASQAKLEPTLRKLNQEPVRFEPNFATYRTRVVVRSRSIPTRATSEPSSAAPEQFTRMIVEPAGASPWNKFNRASEGVATVNERGNPYGVAGTVH